MANTKNKDWDHVLKPHSGWLDINLGGLLKYHELIFLLVKRDFVTFYKQTILGPMWYIIQPLVNSVIFTVIFGKIAKISTDDVPPFIFYLAGTVAWGYFATCFADTSNTFSSNKDIFGKVYFPRLTIPISKVITGMIQFLLQFSIFIGFYAYYIWQGADLRPSYFIFVLPFVVFQMGILGLGAGLLVSSLVTKYRDLMFAMGFCVQIWMYLTPIVYPFSEVPVEYQTIYALNPMVSIVELFRAAFFGVSAIGLVHIASSIMITLVALMVGIVMFSRVEKTFMDTV